MRFWKYRDEPAVNADGRVIPATTATPATTVVERTGPTDHDVRSAYERGRKDERAGRHSHPIITLLIVLLAIVGALAIWLLVRNNGSAVRAGLDAQNQAAQIKAEAPGAIHDAASSVKNTVHQATTDSPSDAAASQ